MANEVLKVKNNPEKTRNSETGNGVSLNVRSVDVMTFTPVDSVVEIVPVVASRVIFSQQPQEIEHTPELKEVATSYTITAGGDYVQTEHATGLITLKAKIDNQSQAEFITVNVDVSQTSPQNTEQAPQTEDPESSAVVRASTAPETAEVANIPNTLNDEAATAPATPDKVAIELEASKTLDVNTDHHIIAKTIIAETIIAETPVSRPDAIYTKPVFFKSRDHQTQKIDNASTIDADIEASVDIEPSVDIDTTTDAAPTTDADIDATIDVSSNAIALGEAISAPRFSPPVFTNGGLVINAAESARSTDVIFTAQAQYEGGLTYEIIGGHPLFAIGDTGAITLAAGKSLNAEISSQHRLEIRATAQNGDSVSQDYTINVIDDDAILLPLEVRDASVRGQVYETSVGTRGDDRINHLGESGGTRIHVKGRGGDDFIIGSRNSDFIRSGGGDDLVYSRDGNDVLIGGAGDDELWGQRGDNILLGGVGDDVLMAGDDADRFVYGFDGGGESWVTNSGRDTIENFRIGQDELFLVDESGGIANLQHGLESAGRGGLGLTFTFDAEANEFDGLIIRFMEEQGIDVNFLGGVATTAITAEAVRGDYTLDLAEVADFEMLAYELGNIGLRFEEFAEIGLPEVNF